MSWYRQEADLLDDPRGVRLLALAGAAGVAALVAVRSWCARRQSETLPAEVARAEVRRLGVSPKKAGALVAALLSAGLLVSSSADVLALPEASTVRREVPVAVPGEADRQTRYRDAKREEIRAKDRARKASRKVSRNVAEQDPEASRNVAESVAERSGAEAPPSQTLPPRT